MAVRVVEQEFANFVRDVEPRLLYALCAAYGFEVGREATADALAHGWEHWDDVRTKDNPAGFLYRVGQSRSRRYLRWRRRKREGLLELFPSPAGLLPSVEPGLAPALGGLSRMQRVAVVLVHGFAYSQAEAAELLGVSRTTVQKHAERGLAKLRSAMGVSHDG